MNRSRPAKKLDPKILDDSSDDADSSSDSDEQIGPILPPVLPSAIPPPQPTTQQIAHLPIQNEATLGSNHSQYITCLALEPSGNRLLTASLDTTAKLWDFNAMTSSLLSFRTLTPLTTSPLRTAHFSQTGASLLLAGSSPNALVTDRDGHAIRTTPRGDMYLADASLTKGHTAGLTAALWSSPHSMLPASSILSSAADATVRVWDVARTVRTPFAKIPVMAQMRVYKIRTARGGKTIPGAMAWARKRIALGCDDGCLRLLDPAAAPHTPCARSEVFAPAGTEVTGVACTAGGSPYVLVRSSDEALRVFDERRLDTAVAVFKNLANTVSETGVVFLGSSGRWFMTGTSADRKKGSVGGLRVFCMQMMREVWSADAPMGCRSVVSVLWHDRLNQIVYGTGDGRVHVLFHESESERGVLRCLARSEFRRKVGVSAVGVADGGCGSEIVGLRRGVSAAGDSPAGDSPAGDSPAGDSPAGDSPADGSERAVKRVRRDSGSEG